MAPDAMRLIETSIDVAQIESLEVGLTAREGKLTVLLPLDFDNPMFE